MHLFSLLCLFPLACFKLPHEFFLIFLSVSLRYHFLDLVFPVSSRSITQECQRRVPRMDISNWMWICQGALRRQVEEKEAREKLLGVGSFVVARQVGKAFESFEIGNSFIPFGVGEGKVYSWHCTAQSIISKAIQVVQINFASLVRRNYVNGRVLPYRHESLYVFWRCCSQFKL